MANLPRAQDRELKWGQAGLLVTTFQPRQAQTQQLLGWVGIQAQPMEMAMEDPQAETQWLLMLAQRWLMDWKKWVGKQH